MLYVVSCIVHCLLSAYVYLFWSVEKRKAYWKDRKIPYDPPIGLIGSMVGVGSKKHSSQVYLECYKKRKGVIGYFGIFNFFTPELIIIDPELIQFVLQCEYVYDFGAYTTKIKPVKQLFKTASKSLNLLSLVLGQSDTIKDVYNLSRRFAIDFTLAGIFSIKSHKLFEFDAEHLAHPKFNEITLTLRRTLPTFFQMRDEFFTKTLRKLIEKDGYYDIGRLMPSDDLAVQSFIGEYETVASTVAFALYELALNEQLQEELGEEVAGFNRQESFDTLEEYELLERVFRGEFGLLS